MTIIEKIKQKNSPLISFELFPPATGKASAKLVKVVDKLQSFHPDFFSVTFPVGGARQQDSLELARQLLAKDLDVIAYIAAYGMQTTDITSILEEFEQAGIKHVLAVRGDKPEHADNTPQIFPYAKDLLAFIQSHFSFCVGVAGYPEGHLESSDLETDINHLKQKVAAGADFIISQYFYDNRYFYNFADRIRQSGISVPILAGIMPIYSQKMSQKLSSMCGATLTSPIKEAFASFGEDDKDGLFEFAVQFSQTQCEDLIAQGVDGLHFYTMDRAKVVTAILSQLRQKGLLETSA